MLIHDSPHIQLLEQPADGDTLLITFAPKNQTANGKTFWGMDVARKLGLSAVGFNAKWAHWYCPEMLDDAIPIVRERARRYRYVITMGSSMGGYAALRHSRALGATHVIAMAPQWSIDPHDVGDHDKRFRKDFCPPWHAGMAIEAAHIGGEAILFFDPTDPEDRFNADRLAGEAPALVMMKTLSTAHFPIEVFKGSLAMGTLISAIKERRHGEIRRMIRDRRRGLAIRPQTLARLSAARKPALARRIFDAFQDRFPPDAAGTLFRELAVQAMKRGDAQGTVAAYDQALRHSPDDLISLQKLAALHARAGRGDLALAFADRAACLRPQDANIIVLLGKIAFDAGRVEEAKARYRAALDMDASNFSGLYRLGELCLATNGADEALVWARRATESNLTNADAWVLRCRCAIVLSLWLEAAMAHERVVLLSPAHGALKRLADQISQGVSAHAIVA